MSKLRVLIDARKFGDGGIGRYLEWLTRGLSIRSDIEQTLLVESEQAVPTGVVAKNVFVSPFKKYSLSEYLYLLSDLDRTQFDIFHTPHFTLPRTFGLPSVVTIHDIIHLTNPSRWYQPFLAKLMIGSAVWRADKLITVSKAAGEDIVDHFPQAAKKLSVIGHPVANWNSVDADITYEPFLLVVISQDRAHKGIDDILKILADIKDQIALPVVLVGYGTEGRKMSKASGSIFIKGKVPDDDLHQLYLRCSGVIIPSRAEGFGFAMIEAKRFNKRVCLRPLRSLLELSGERDVISDDMSLRAFRRAILEFALICIRDPAGSPLEKVGLDIQTLIAKTVEIYLQAAGSRNPALSHGQSDHAGAKFTHAKSHEEVL